MSLLTKSAMVSMLLLFAGHAEAQQQPPIPYWQMLTSNQPAQPLSVVLPTGMKLTALGVFDIGKSYFTSVSNGTNTGSSGSVLRGESGALTVSKIGLKGEQPLNSLGLDPLGLGAKFIFDIEAGVDLTRFTGNDPNHFFSRNAWFGVAGNLGTLTFGRQWNFNDDYLIGSVFTGGYPLSIFRLTEFGELSDLHDNVVKYVTPAFHGIQAGVYYQFDGDTGATSLKDKALEFMVSYKLDPVTIAAVYDQQTDPFGNVISQMESFGASYRVGKLKFRGGFAVNHLTPGNTPYPGGAGPISVLTPETAAAYLAGIDWNIAPKWVISGDFVYRDNLTLANNTQIYRLLLDYTLNAYVDIYAQVAFMTNAAGAAESFYSWGAATYLGSGYADQSQFAAQTGLRFKF